MDLRMWIVENMSDTREVLEDIVQEGQWVMVYYRENAVDCACAMLDGGWQDAGRSLVR